MDNYEKDCNVLEYAVYVKALVTANCLVRLVEYAAFVAVSEGADVERGRRIAKSHGMEIRKVVKSAAEDLILAFGNLATADDEAEAEAETAYESARRDFVDVLAAYVYEMSSSKEFELVRWEVRDPQPVVLPSSNS